MQWNNIILQGNLGLYFCKKYHLLIQMCQSLVQIFHGIIIRNLVLINVYEMFEIAVENRRSDRWCVYTCSRTSPEAIPVKDSMCVSGE